MNKIKSYFSLGSLAALTMIACEKKAENPIKYVPKNDSAKVDYQKIDTTELKIANLPIHLKQMDFLMHPIGKIRVNQTKEKIYSSDNNSVSYSIATTTDPEITGLINNVMFQSLKNDSLIRLTDRKMLIQSIRFIDEIVPTTNKKILVYTAIDADTNRDGKYDQNDIKTLYISLQNGEQFRKISPDMEEFLDYTIISSNNRLYFRTIKDINKNGNFDADDHLNYYYIQLLDKDWKLNNYQPTH